LTLLPSRYLTLRQDLAEESLAEFSEFTSRLSAATKERRQRDGTGNPGIVLMLRVRSQKSSCVAKAFYRLPYKALLNEQLAPKNFIGNDSPLFPLFFPG